MGNSCSATTLDRTGRQPAQSLATIMPGLALVAMFGMPTLAHAVDGCTVLLCFAAPNWRSIPQCVPPIQQVLRDLARGKPFPTCAMAGAGSFRRPRWAFRSSPAC